MRKALMSPAGTPRPSYEPLRDGSEVSLGGTTLVAHFTPGHTPGCTTWTMAKYARVNGPTNPFVDPQGYLDEVTVQETAFNNELERQQTEGPPAGRGRAGT